jgi:hypothetical protein
MQNHTHGTASGEVQAISYHVVSVTARKRHKAQISRRRRTVCGLLDSAYIRGSKAKGRRRREEGKGSRCYIYRRAVARVS